VPPKQIARKVAEAKPGESIVAATTRSRAWFSDELSRSIAAVEQE